MRSLTLMIITLTCIKYSKNHILSRLKIPYGSECQCLKTEKVGKTRHHYTNTFCQVNIIFCSCVQGNKRASPCFYSCKHTQAFRYTHCPDPSGDMPNVKLSAVASIVFRELLSAQPGRGAAPPARTPGAPAAGPGQGLSPGEGAARPPRPVRSPRRQRASAHPPGRAGRAAAGRGNSA